MFNDTITIFNIIKDNDSTIYQRSIVQNVLFLSEKILSQDGNGEKYTSTHRVIFPKESLTNYVKKSEFEADNGKFTLRSNDIIVKGEIDEITSQNDLKNDINDYFLIKTISDYSEIDSDICNIEVTD